MSPARVRIGRIAIDLRGVGPDAARALASAIGPALQRAIADGSGGFTDAAPIDAATIRSAPSPDPKALAATIAGRIAARSRDGGGR